MCEIIMSEMLFYLLMHCGSVLTSKKFFAVASQTQIGQHLPNTFKVKVLPLFQQYFN